MTEQEPAVDRTKVRQGLALITAVVLVAVVLFLVVDSPVGKAMMVAVGFTAVVRAFLLSRSLRRDG